MDVKQVGLDIIVTTLCMQCKFFIILKTQLGKIIWFSSTGLDVKMKRREIEKRDMKAGKREEERYVNICKLNFSKKKFSRLKTDPLFLQRLYSGKKKLGKGSLLDNCANVTLLFNKFLNLCFNCCSQVSVDEIFK